MNLLEITIPPTLVPTANIHFVGEAGGEEEERQGKGFVGPAGQLLDKMLHVATVDRATCSISNVVKLRPPDNDFKVFYNGKYPTQELLQWYEFLADELGAASPNVVVAVGDEALQALCGHRGVLSYRGGVLESALVRGMKVIPIIHPAYILRRNFWGAVYWTIFDLKYRILPQSTFPGVERLPYEELIWPEFHEVEMFLEGIGDNDRWCLDVETVKNNGGGRLRCVGIARRNSMGQDLAIVVPLQTHSGPYFDAASEALFWECLAKLAKRNPNLVNQNIPYDIEYLLDYGVVPSGVYMDCMLAHHTIWPELPKDLGFINSRFSDIPYHKGDRDWTWRTADEDLFHYNVKDTISTLRDSFALDVELDSAGLKDYYHSYVNRLVELAVHMQRSKMQVDMERLEHLRSLAAEELAATKAKREAITGIMNVGSSKQVQHYLYTQLGLRPIKNRTTHMPTANEDALRELATKYHGEGLNLIIAERHLTKRKNDYLDDLELDPDGYLPLGCYPDFTITDRWVFKKSPKYRGLNAQTFPEVLRIPFVPEAGREFVSFDLKNIESVIDAYESGCKYMKEVFADPSRNFHTETAQMLFGHKVDKNTVDGAIEYKIGKITNHAFEKGEGPKRLAITTGLSFPEAKRFLRKLQQQRQEIGLWHKDVERRIREDGVLTNCLGRRFVPYTALGAMLILKGVLPSNLVRQGIAWIAQSVPPALVNRACLDIMDSWSDCWLHHHGHDSALFSVPTHQAEEFVLHALPLFSPRIKIHGESVQVKVEYKRGFSWGFELASRGDTEIRKMLYGDTEYTGEEDE